MPAPESSVVLTAWNTFQKEDVLDNSSLSPIVAESWLRCRKLGLDPFDSDKYNIKGLELKQRLTKSRNMISVARPFMESLYDFVRGTGFQVVLADEYGFILDVIGDREIKKKTKEVQLCPGGSWQESVKGTNAIGTAIVEKKPVQIYAWEHFCKPNHFLICSAAPILDQDGQVVGVLDVSGDYVYANPHTLGMVVASVRAIENQLRLEAATRKLFVAYQHSKGLLDSISEGVISATSEGLITHINNEGARLLGIHHKDLVGKHVSEVAVDCPQITDLLAPNTEERGRDISVVKSGRIIRTSSKPMFDQSGNTIGTIATMREAKKEKEPEIRRYPAAQARYRLEDIIGPSEVMAQAKHIARLAARSTSTVLLTGETGTGKELFSHAIHLAGLRGIGPFVAINCGAMPESLIESELFGYEDGAFTGAKKGGQAGKFETANGGTIFLDEIGDMPLSTQVKLLRIIQEKRVSRVGGKGEIPVDVRIIASTNRDLKEEVKRGSFREDLFYRLNVVSIRIPALRERASDIPFLLNYFIEKIGDRLDRSGISIHNDFLRAALDYNWPGNVRELEHTIERALNLIPDGGVLTPEFLPSYKPAQPGTPKFAAEIKPDAKPLRDLERETIMTAIRQCKGNLSKAASKLGIGRSTLYRKIKSYNITLQFEA